MIFIIIYIYMNLYLCIYTPLYPHFKAFPVSKFNSETNFSISTFQGEFKYHSFKAMQANKWSYFLIFIIIYVYSYLYLCIYTFFKKLKPCKMFMIIYVCMYVCLYVCMYVCMHVCINFTVKLKYPCSHCGLRTVPPLAKLGGEFGTRAYRNISQM